VAQCRYKARQFNRKGLGMLRWRILGIFAFCVSALLSNSSANASEITVATLNIKFYGYDLSSESNLTNGYTDPRNRSLRKYIIKNLGDADVITFQEIVDVTAFKKKVLKNSFRCRTYNHENKDHLHVLICYKKKYRLSKPFDDDNYIIEESTLGRRIRPVLHGILTEVSTGKKVAYIAAVHLKANEYSSETRKKQIKIISKKMRANAGNLPKIIMGDFNTHGSDVAKFNRIFRSSRLGLRHITNPNRYTYRVPEYNSKLDHFWVNPSKIELQGTVKTSRICNDGSSPTGDYSSVASYNRNISDHCFLKAKFKLQN